MKGLWKRVLSDAEGQVASIKQVSESQIEEHLQSKILLEKHIQGLQQQNNQQKHDIQSLTNDKLTLEAAVHTLHAEIIRLKADASSFEQRLNDKQYRADELIQLNKQVQTNLDHYRDSVREQLIKEQKQYDQQIKHLEQSLHQQQNENSSLTNQLKQAQEKHEKIETERNELVTHQNKIASDLHEAKLQLNSLETQLESSNKGEAKLQSEFDELKNNLKAEKQQSEDSQRQLALTAQKLEQAQKQFSDALHQNKSLAHDKWIMGQEKAELSGQLRQMEKIA